MPIKVTGGEGISVVCIVQWWLLLNQAIVVNKPLLLVCF